MKKRVKKRCTKCGEEKPLDNKAFIKKNKGRIQRDTALLAVNRKYQSKSGLRVIAEEALENLDKALSRLEKAEQ